MLFMLALLALKEDPEKINLKILSLLQEPFHKRFGHVYS